MLGNGSPNWIPYDANTRAVLENNTVTIPKASLDNNAVDLSSAVTFNVADLRLAFQIQKWLERNARAGVRYTEFLGSHFGVHPRTKGYRDRNISAEARTRS